MSKSAPPVAVKITTLEGFNVGALAAMTAVTVTNPMEVCKTRMQLQGELEQAVSKGEVKAAPTRLYKNALDCFAKTLQSEGIRGVQKGLGAAYIYQVLLNGSRLGFYEPFRRGINRAVGKDAKEVWTIGALLAGASSGVVGAMLGNPFFLVKARIQAYSPHVKIGKASHAYKNMWEGLGRILREEGVRGLGRGMDAAVLRTAMGSTAQLPAYNWAKSYLTSIDPEKEPYNPFKWFAGKPNALSTYLASSIFSGLCVCAVMQPADTALTRMYNQPVRIDEKTGRAVGVLYKSPIDCMWQTAKAEGPIRGLYKGTTAHLLRIAPHTVLTLVMNEAYMGWYTDFKKNK